MDDLEPSEACGSKWLDILGAGPECTHHSNARAGKPKNEQSRASAWNICRWAEHLRIGNILIENVREFRDWCPLNAQGNPIKSRKGETFKAFMNALCSLGYQVEDRVLCAADYGDPTTRERLFIMATRRRAGVRWPKPSHSQAPTRGLKSWVPAKDIIDWDYPSESIFDRKRGPLAAGTLRRIAAGFRKFGGPNAEAFLVMMYGTGAGRSIHRPLPTVTCGGGRGGGHIALAQPFIVPIDNRSTADGSRPIGKPIGTITTKNRWALCEPFITEVNHETPESQLASRNHSVKEPLRTLSTHNGYGLTEPFLVRYKGTGKNEKFNVRSVERPMPTLVAQNDMGIVEPCLVKYYGTADAASIEEPLDTVTTKERFGLAEPVACKVNGQYYLDIRFRMLQPHELAAAMGFEDFEFVGTKAETVKQIGNGVPRRTARALCIALLKPDLLARSVA